MGDGESCDPFDGRSSPSDEESSLLLDRGTSRPRCQPDQVSSESSTSYHRKVLAALAMSSLAILSMSVFMTPQSFSDITNHHYASISKSMMMSIFQEYEKTTGGNSNSKELIYLDRHDLNCGTDVIHQFHMRNSGWNSVWYQYSCMTVSPLAKLVDKYSADNGFNEDHNLIYYDRQKMYCDSDYLLTRFYGRNNK